MVRTGRGCEAWSRLGLGAAVLAAAVVMGAWGSRGPARPPVPDAEDVAHIPTEDRTAGGDERMRYLLAGPRQDEPEPEDGYRLLIVLPGGTGEIDFHPFVKRIHMHALPTGYLVAQPVAVRWSEEQARQNVWPTAGNRPPEAGFTTEEFIDAVVADVKGRFDLDERYIFTLSWSSSGPAAYAAALREKTPITGSLVAMSVYKPDQLPPRENAEGRAFYILHSPDDRVCPLRMAEQARDELKEHGAAVEFKTYKGGHGWRGPVYQWIGTGVGWLEKEAEKRAAVDGAE